MTPRQAELLASIRDSGGMHLRGADVRVARHLERAKLIAITDNGKKLDAPGGHDDGERWWVEPMPERPKPDAAEAEPPLDAPGNGG
jgi:hypothetical protein